MTTLLTTDADFLAAEREIAEVRAERNALLPSIETQADEERLDKPLSDRMWALYDQITLSPPVSLASAAVKLRLLADPDLGLENNEGVNDVASSRQALGLVERMAGGDDEILSLFREWCEVEREADAASDEEFDAVLGRADLIEDRLYGIAASGPVGLVIKGYLLAHMTSAGLTTVGLTPDDALASLGRIRPEDYRSDGTLRSPVRGVLSFAEDAVRIVPELAPLVAGIICACAVSIPDRRGGLTMKTTKARKGRDMSAADIIKEAWRIVTSMEDDAEHARIFALGVAILAAEAIHDDEQLGSVFCQLGYQIAAHCKAVEERRGELFQLLHPNRAIFLKEGWPGKVRP